jgi:Fic-DOC domain mobile mystery protein B
VGLNLEYLQGQTPLDEDEKEGLLIKSITTRSDLDEFEQLNIEKAVEWTLGKNLSVEKILTVEFIKDLHKRMFGDVWKWAGEYRRTNKNIGVDKYDIAVNLIDLLRDTNLWVKDKVFDEDQIAVRFSHRIVKIHLFPNGNGRHSRLIADILISQGFGKKEFTWGQSNLTEKGNEREKYLSALRLADDNQYSELIKFAGS